MALLFKGKSQMDGWELSKVLQNPLTKKDS